MIAAKASSSSLNPPDSNLGRKMTVDIMYKVRVVHDQFQRYNVPSSMYTLIGASAARQTRLFRVIGIRLRYGSSRNKGIEEVSLYRSKLVVSTQSVHLSTIHTNRRRAVNLHLHTLVPRTCIAQQHGDLSFRSPRFSRNFLW